MRRCMAVKIALDFSYTAPFKLATLVNIHLAVGDRARKSATLPPYPSEVKDSSEVQVMQITDVEELVSSPPPLSATV